MTDKKKTKKRSNPKPTRMVTVEEDDEPAAPPPKTVPKKKKSKSSDRSTPAVVVTKYPPEVVTSATDFIKWAHGLGIDGLLNYWQNDLMFKNPPMAPAPSFEANRDKNRYQDVICLEETRVKLVKEDPTDGDYIHANYVKFPGYDRTYICTQGPLENTMEDFWRMIWQEKTPIIVNLTGCCETTATGERKSKCAEYWSLKENESKQIGRYNVLTKKKETDGGSKFDSYIVEVLPTGCSDSHIVRLIHSGMWPDGSVMNKPSLVLKIIKQIYNADTLASGPILVHCSAGIGRTGTMVLIDYLLYRIFVMKAPANLPEAFGQIRQQRASAVQNPAQFIYIVLTVAKYINGAMKIPELKDWTEELERDFKAKGLGKGQQ